MKTPLHKWIGTYDIRRVILCRFFKWLHYPEKIKSLLAKPFNPYIRRHSALTEKSTKLKSSTLEQYTGWVPGSTMQKCYVHYFGNESSVDILEVYGMKVSDSIPINSLNPKICPNCNESNTQDAKFCSKCKMIMSF